MDEFIPHKLSESKDPQNAEIKLATVVARTYNDGYRLKIDGETEASEKYYKRLATGVSPMFTPNDRVLVLKYSGTYVVLGKVAEPGTLPYSNYYFSGPNYTLPTSATLQTVINRLNFVCNALVGMGIITTNNDY